MSEFLRIQVARQGSPTKNYKVASIRLPGYDGDFGIMAHRSPIMGVMQPGLIHITDLEGKKYVYATTGGFYEMVYNKLTLIFDTLFYPEDLPESVKNAKKRTYLRDTASMGNEEKQNYVMALLAQEVKNLSK